MQPIRGPVPPVAVSHWGLFCDGGLDVSLIWADWFLRRVVMFWSLLLLNALERKQWSVVSTLLPFIHQTLHTRWLEGHGKTKLHCVVIQASDFGVHWAWCRSSAGCGSDWRASTLCVSTSSWSELTHSPVDYREQGEPSSPGWWGCFFRGFQARNLLWTRLHRSVFHRQGEDWSTVVFPSCYLQPLWRLRSFVCLCHIQAR